MLLRQTVIGQEAVTQMEMADAEPDIVIGCFGGGSNFAGIGFPFLRKDFRRRASGSASWPSEPSSCPKLTRGQFQYDFGMSPDTRPCSRCTLGHRSSPRYPFAPGLHLIRCPSIVSQLLKDGLIEAQSVPQVETLAAGACPDEGSSPPRDGRHRAAAIRLPKRKEERLPRTILFNLSKDGVIRPHLRQYPAC